MAVLVDTNILFRLMQPHAPQAGTALQALQTLRNNGEPLHIVSQVLFEFWAVATRPQADNGLGLTTDQASVELRRVKGLFALLPERPLQAEWERLVVTFQAAGKSSHDARLVAAMHVHGLGRILTFNGADFRRFHGLTVLDPQTICQGQP